VSLFHLSDSQIVLQAILGLADLEQEAFLWIIDVCLEVRNLFLNFGHLIFLITKIIIVIRVSVSAPLFLCVVDLLLIISRLDHPVNLLQHNAEGVTSLQHHKHLSDVSRMLPLRSTLQELRNHLAVIVGAQLHEACGFHSVEGFIRHIVVKNSNGLAEGNLFVSREDLARLVNFRLDLALLCEICEEVFIFTLLLCSLLQLCLLR